VDNKLLVLLQDYVGFFLGANVDAVV